MCLLAEATNRWPNQEYKNTIKVLQTESSIGKLFSTEKPFTRLVSSSAAEK